MDPGKLITPPLDANSFEAGGVIYTATEDISIARYRILQKWEIEFGFDGSFRAQWEATTAIKEAIDQRKSISEIAYINEGLRRGITQIDRNLIYQLQVVSLWFNAPDEDPLTYDHEANTAKMRRWEAAGIGMGFFFAKAAACVRGFREAWLKSIQETHPELPSAPSPSPTSPPS
jgi:hypothetical protein